MFDSIFAKEMATFLELRRSSVGAQTLAHDTVTLAKLDCHLAKHDYRKRDLSEEILFTWIRTLSGKSKTVKEKVLAVRNFVRYLNGMGGRSFLPDVPKAKSDYIPYIYSDEELLLLIHYADHLEPKSPKACCTHLLAMIPMILRILYGCGTRLGETMALRRKDVDFKARTIFLRETKNSKERRIPVHDTLISIIERYCLALGIMLSSEAYLFPGKKSDSHLTKRQVQHWFSELLKLADIDQRETQTHERGATLHCFRHVFVLKSMQQLEAAGHPVDMNDLLLPTYLGHECLLDTDKYMRFSGAQIPDSLEAFETFAAGLIPAVEVPYEDE
ncbi:MAG: tyrosine-type recombinase/integrase [Oscillospiraceae bacterium]|nr:tyrosine-type recombinase/integrase [Oscillospiraceae bacterium]